MEKIAKKIYLYLEDEKKLRLKAEGMGFKGRGWLGAFLHKIANSPLVLLDENVKGLLNALNITAQKKGFPIAFIILEPLKDLVGRRF